MVNLRNIHSDPRGNATGIFYLRTLLFAALLSLCADLQGQARVQAEDTRKNFGSVKRGSVVKAEYDIFNAGSEPLIIKNAEVACSCTSVEFPRQPIDPGKHATLQVSFNTTSVYGRQDREVLIHSNDPKSPLKLRFKAMVSKK